jgi:putative hydrolase of the HAD superfamily
VSTVEPAGEIRAIGVDLMDTVIADPWAEALEAATGLGLAEILSLRDSRAWIDFELGQVDEATYAERFFPPGSGHRLDGRALRRELEARYRFLPGMEDLLARLAPRRRLVAVSNYPEWIDLLRVRFSLDRFFGEYRVSCRLGARKPDRAFFEAVLASCGLEPGELLLVDDRAENVEGAARLGIPGILFRGAEALEEALRERGLL